MHCSNWFNRWLNIYQAISSDLRIILNGFYDKIISTAFIYWIYRLALRRKLIKLFEGNIFISNFEMYFKQHTQMQSDVLWLNASMIIIKIDDLSRTPLRNWYKSMVSHAKQSQLVSLIQIKHSNRHTTSKYTHNDNSDCLMNFFSLKSKLSMTNIEMKKNIL